MLDNKALGSYTWWAHQGLNLGLPDYESIFVQKSLILEYFTIP